jgi:hypothetical protein
MAYLTLKNILQNYIRLGILVIIKIQHKIVADLTVAYLEAAEELDRGEKLDGWPKYGVPVSDAREDIDSFFMSRSDWDFLTDDFLYESSTMFGITDSERVREFLVENEEDLIYPEP